MGCLFSTKINQNLKINPHPLIAKTNCNNGGEDENKENPGNNLCFRTNNASYVRL